MSDSPRSPSRRDFVVRSSLGVASASLLTNARAEVAGGLRNDEIRIGLIGCGGRGTGAAQQALSTKGPIKLVAMGDAFSDRLEGSLRHLSGSKKVKGRVDVPEDRRFVGFDAFKQVLEQDIDAVVLATPPHFRAEHFEAAVNAGKHVFMEKPVAVDGFGVRRVLAAGKLADEKELSVVVGLQRHYQNGYLELMQRVKEGAIGRIVAARCYWNMGELWSRERAKGWSDMEFQMRNWLYYAWLSGDHITEQHIHNLDVVNWAMGKYPVSCQGSGGRQVRTKPVFGHIFDHHSVEYVYDNGTRMFSQCRQIPGCFNKVSEHLMGTEANADFEGNRYRISTNGKPTWQYSGPNNNPYQTEHDELFAAIRGAPRINNAEYGAKSSLTAIMGRMATYSGKLVTWDQAMNSPRLGPDRYEWSEISMPSVPTPGA